MKKKLLITGAALIILLIIAVKYSSSHRGPVTDVPIVSHDTYSITYTEESLQKEIDKIDYEKLNWYTDIDEAFSDVVDEEVYEKETENNLVLITQLESDILARRIYYEPMDTNVKVLVCYDVIKKENSFSQVAYTWRVITNDFQYGRYEYTCLDSAAEGLWSNYFDLTPFFEVDGTDYIGFWNDEEEIKKLRFSGEPVDDIYELKYNDGTTLYMWNKKLNGVYDALNSIKGDVTPRKIAEKVGITVQ